MEYEIKKGIFKKVLATLHCDYSILNLVDLINQDNKFNIKFEDVKGIDSLLNTCGVLLVEDEVPNKFYTTANLGNNYNIAMKCVGADIKGETLSLTFDVLNNQQGEVIVSFLKQGRCSFSLIPNCVLERRLCKILNFDLMIKE